MITDYSEICACVCLLGPGFLFLGMVLLGSIIQGSMVHLRFFALPLLHELGMVVFFLDIPAFFAEASTVAMLVTTETADLFHTYFALCWSQLFSCSFSSSMTAAPDALKLFEIPPC